VNCGVGHRCVVDLALLWLWCRPAAVALIQPLAWESPYAAAGVAIKSPKKQKKKRKERKKEKKAIYLKYSLCKTLTSIFNIMAFETWKNGHTYLIKLKCLENTPNTISNLLSFDDLF